MKKISLILAMAGMVWTIQTAHAQTTEDTTKNRIEIKKKVKTGAHGRQVTKIKMVGKGTQGSLHDAADGVTGKLPAPVIVTPPPPPPPEKVNTEPTIVVVQPAPVQPVETKPVETPPVQPTTTTVTTTSETKPVQVEGSTSSSRTTASAHVMHRKHVYHHVYTKKPAVASSTKTTTTTTIKKGE